ncbi:hypothetical protein JW897_16415 [Chromobacterium alkanivorans]|uniref:hypothetical protein n=1 Tax=Chromobacterium alkanivorans TaxID=1071719 RepID=UPI00196804AA|nr:hypothetical protein [Chromobacterium alkanivorans]MBN3005321.1 hypothetical protein [Chromobacterium alkanivorans]
MDREKHAEALDGLNGVKHKIAIYWRLYVDWLAGLGWGRLALISLLALILSGVLALSGAVVFLILMSFLVKACVAPKPSRPAALTGRTEEEMKQDRGAYRG